MGVSVEDIKAVFRINDQRKTKPKTKFLSCEPLIGPLPKMNLNKIDWVIVGGESGRKPRKMETDWVLDIQTQCSKAGVSFFFKQWGSNKKKKEGRMLEGETFSEFPPQYSQHLENLEELGY